MAMIENWFDQDLHKPVHTKYLNGNVFSQDNQANLIGVNVFDNGSPATLSGTVSANIIRQDGATVSVDEGTLDGNKCSIILPSVAYAVPGQIAIIIKLTTGETVTTLLSVIGSVYRSSTDTVVYPGEIIPSIQQLIAQIDSTVSEAQTAVDGIEAQKNTMIASIASVAGQGTDTTLTQSGVAADAKATGDLKSALNVVENEVFYPVKRVVNTTVSNYRLQNTGYCASTSGYKMLKYAVTAGDLLKVVSDDKFQFQNSAFVPSSDTLKRVGETYGTGTYFVVVPSSATYLIVSTPDSGNADVYGTEVSVMDKITYLSKYSNTNIFDGATWQQGSYVSVATYSNTTINAGNTRISTQVTLQEPLSSEMLISILNNSYSYECGLFDADGASLGYKTGWQTEDWNVSASKPIKYVRLNIRKSDDSNISAYSNEVGGYQGAFVSLKDAYKVSTKINGLEGQITYENEQIIWNQLASVFTRASGTLVGVTYTRSADSKTVTLNGTATGSDFYQLINSGLGTSVSGHKYLVYTPKAEGSSTKYWFYLNSRDVHDYGQGAIWTAGSATNIVYGIEIKQNAVFDNLTIDVPIIVDLTLAFGAGNEPDIDEFVTMFPNDVYPYDGGTQRNLTRMELNARNIYKLADSVGANGDHFLQLNIMAHNCGHFNYGSSSEYSGDDVQEKVAEWKAMIARNKPDIVLAQECSQYFDASQTINAYNTLYKPLLPNMYYLSYTRIISKYKPTKTWQLDLTVTVDGQTETRSNGCCEINVDGITIGICSAHLSPGYDTHANNVREAQRDIIINAFADYDYVIIGGDFNAQADSFYSAFTDAGYLLANHGYFGNINTFPNEPIDNVIVKGFAFYNAYSKAEDICTSDHQPLVADMLIQVN